MKIHSFIHPRVIPITFDLFCETQKCFTELTYNLATLFNTMEVKDWQDLKWQKKKRKVHSIPSLLTAFLRGKDRRFSHRSPKIWTFIMEMNIYLQGCIKMIKIDTEDWRNGFWKFSFSTKGINYILKHMKIIIKKTK